MKTYAVTAPGGREAKCASRPFFARNLFRPSRRAYLLVLLSLSLGELHARAQINVVTSHNDIGRTGQNLNETILTPSNVNPTQFGKLFTQNVNGWMFAQPLYVQQVPIGGISHNVVYAATINDMVYAFDADTNGGSNSNPLWQVSLLNNSTPSGTTYTLNGGVWGTPAINTATGDMWLVSSEYQTTSTSTTPTPIFRLHVLNIKNGAEEYGGPIQIQASIAGTGSDSSGGVLNFDPVYQKQRPGLLFLNGVAYVAFGSNNDEGAWHGWLFSYSVNTATKTLQRNDVFCTAPNGSGGGLWMGGAGPAAEVYSSSKPYGRMFLTVANGTYSTATTPTSWGMTVLDLDLTNGKFTVEDSFTPYNAVALSSQDADLGSGGPILLPTQTLASGQLLNPLLQIGKAGMFYVLDRDNNNDGSNNPATEYSPAGLGGFNATADQVIQEIQTPPSANFPWGAGVWGTNAYWNNNIYSGGTNVASGNNRGGTGNSLTAYSFINGVMSTTPTSQSQELYVYPGPTPSVSANGATDGIVWALNSVPQPSGATFLVLLAYDATNLGNTLYSSNTNFARDAPGNAEKYPVPTIANGKVYVGASGKLDVYGLLSNPTAPAPSISPGPETFVGSMTVTITDALPGATIYYTTDGSTPTTRSAVYPASTGLTISNSETITAIASVSGYITSSPSAVAYTSTTVPLAPVLSLAAGTYIGPQTLTITDSSTTATIYYTLDGMTPTPGAADTSVYSQAFPVTASETVTAIAVNPGPFPSTSTSAAYVIEPIGTIDFTQGFTTANGPMQFNGDTTLDDFRLQLTDGGTSEASSAFYATPVNIQAFTTNFTFQMSNPVGDGMTFTIQNVGPTALGGYGSSLGYKGMAKSAAIKFDMHNSAGEGSDSTGLYIDGAVPTVPAIDMTSTGINLHSGDYFNVALTYDGSTLNMTLTDQVTMATASYSFIIDIPAIVGGSTAYVGFTAGTGATTSSQKLTSWLYEPQPLPNSSATFALGSMTLNGGAAFNGSRLRLTDGNPSEARSAFLNTRVNVQQFTTSFNFQLTNPTGDGMTFTLQNMSPTAVGSIGGNLGYSSHVTPSVAIKFDLYSNAGEGPDSTGMYLDGASPTVPSTDLSSTGINLHSGDAFNAQLTYNGTVLKVVITDLVTGASATQSYTVNIPATLGASTAYAGFTAASGGGTAIQEIINWTYSVPSQ